MQAAPGQSGNRGKPLAQMRLERLQPRHPGRPCRAAIKVRRPDNQGEKAFCGLRRREGGAHPEAQAAEKLA